MRQGSRLPRQRIQKREDFSHGSGVWFSNWWIFQENKMRRQHGQGPVSPSLTYMSVYMYVEFNASVWLEK